MRGMLGVTILGCCLCACTVSERVVLEDSEGSVPRAFFKSVKNDHSNRDWLVANLGQPLSVEDSKSGAQILTWHFQESRQRFANALLVLRYSAAEEQSSFYHVIICDALVRKTWWDHVGEVDSDRVTHKLDCASAAQLSDAGT